MRYLVFSFAIVGGWLAFSVTAGTLPAEEAPPSSPARIWSNDAAFLDIGRAISRRKDFPRRGTDVDKARYVFAQLPWIARQLDLHAGANQEKSTKEMSLATSSEWSHAMQAMLAGAGVASRRVSRVDKAPSPGMSANAVEPTMALIVEERTPEGRMSRRVFDAFRAGYHGPLRQPNALTVSAWGDRPLSAADKLPRDLGRISWLKKLTKPLAKDGGMLRLLVPLVSNSKVSVPGPIAHSVFLGTTTLWLLRSR